jgi:hypothetical protein
MRPHLSTLGLFVGSTVFTLLVFKVFAMAPSHKQHQLSKPLASPTEEPVDRDRNNSETGY